MRKSGFAQKRGTSGFFSATFSKHKRFFQLDETGFFYAEDAASAGARKRIDVFLSKIVTRSTTGLEIATSEKTYPLDFSSREERDSWYEALLSAQRQRVADVEALVARLERALEKRAAKSNVAFQRGDSRLASRKPGTPAEFLERLDVLTGRLELAVV